MTPLHQQEWQNLLHFPWFPSCFMTMISHWMLPLLGSDRLKWCLLNFSLQYTAVLLNRGRLDTRRRSEHPYPPSHDQDLTCSRSWSSLVQRRELGSLGVESLKKLVLGEWEHRKQNSGKPTQMEERAQQETQVDETGSPTPSWPPINENQALNRLITAQ